MGQKSERESADKKPVLLGAALLGLGLVAVAVALYATRGPAAETKPPQAPPQLAASTDTAKPEPETTPTVLPPVAPPSAATTIVLAEDPTPANGVAEVWDGRSLRGPEDAPTVFNRAIEDAGGEQAVSALSRFSARVIVSQPVTFSAELAFDLKRGIALRRLDLEQTLVWTVAGRCVQWRTSERIAVSCRDDQILYLQALWQVAKIWSLTPLRDQKIQTAVSLKRGKRSTNIITFHKDDKDLASQFITSFDATTGRLLSTALQTSKGRVFAFLGNHRAGTAGTTVATEWTLYPPGFVPSQMEGKEPTIDFPLELDDLAKADQLEKTPLFGPIVLYLHQFSQKMDASAFVVPPESELNRDRETASLRPERIPALLLPLDVASEDRNSDENLVANSWLPALVDELAVEEEDGTRHVGIGLESTTLLPPNLVTKVRPLTLTGVPTGLALGISPSSSSMGRQFLVDKLLAQGRVGRGTAYFSIWVRMGSETAARLFGGGTMASEPKPANP